MSRRDPLVPRKHGSSDFQVDNFSDGTLSGAGGVAYQARLRCCWIVERLREWASAPPDPIPRTLLVAGQTWDAMSWGAHRGMLCAARIAAELALLLSLPKWQATQVVVMTTPAWPWFYDRDGTEKMFLMSPTTEILTASLILALQRRTQRVAVLPFHELTL